MGSSSTTIDTKEEVENSFNHFIVHLGPNLAEELPKVQDQMFTNSPKSETMFLEAVCESDVLHVVRKI